MFLPADPSIGASAVPLTAERSQPFQDEQALLLREAHDGPVWPSIVTYGFVGGSVAALVAVAIAGVVGLGRRQRSGPIPSGLAQRAPTGVS